MRMRRRTTAERSRINGRIEWSPRLTSKRAAGWRTEDSEAAEGEEDAVGHGSERWRGGTWSVESVASRRRKVVDRTRRGRGATRSPLRCTLSR